MNAAITEYERAFRVTKNASPWDHDIKASDDVIPQLLREFHHGLGEKVTLTKRFYCDLVDFMQPEEVDKEIVEKLDLIQKIAQPS